MRRLIMVIVSVVVLAACSGEENPADPESSATASSKKTSASPTPTAPASVESLLDYIPDVPPVPRQEFTKASAIAFAEYFFAVTYYAYGQDDVTPLLKITDPDCSGCAKTFKNLQSQKGGGFVLIGEGPARLEGSQVSTTGDIAEVKTTLNLPRVTLVKLDSGKQSGDWVKAKSGPTTIRLQFDPQDGWTVLDYDDIY